LLWFPAAGAGVVVPSDPTQRFAALLAELTPVQQRASAAVEQGTATVHGRDSSEMVTVSLNGDGRVSAVEVRAGWRRPLPMQALGAAVREAV
jgi:DNA-binding protein YbaB